MGKGARTAKGAAALEKLGEDTKEVADFANAAKNADAAAVRTVISEAKAAEEAAGAAAKSIPLSGEVGSFAVGGWWKLVGQTAEFHIPLLGRAGGETGSLFTFVRSIEQMAANAGAKQVRIVGEAITKSGEVLKNSAVWERLGYVYKEIGDTIELTKVLK